MNMLQIDAVGVPAGTTEIDGQTVSTRCLSRSPGVFIGAVDNRAAPVYVGDTIRFSPDLREIVPGALYVVAVRTNSHRFRYLVVSAAAGERLTFLPCAEGFAAIDGANSCVTVIGRVISIDAASDLSEAHPTKVRASGRRRWR